MTSYREALEHNYRNEENLALAHNQSEWEDIKLHFCQLSDITRKEHKYKRAQNKYDKAEIGVKAAKVNLIKSRGDAINVRKERVKANETQIQDMAAEIRDKEAKAKHIKKQVNFLVDQVTKYKHFALENESDTKSHDCEAASEAEGRDYATTEKRIEAKLQQKQRLNDLEDIKADVKSVDAKIMDMKSEVAAMEDEVAEDNSKIKEMEEETERLQTELKTGDRDIQCIEAEIEDETMANKHSLKLLEDELAAKESVLLLEYRYRMAQNKCERVQIKFDSARDMWMNEDDPDRKELLRNIMNLKFRMLESAQKLVTHYVDQSVSVHA